MWGRLSTCRGLARPELCGAGAFACHGTDLMSKLSHYDPAGQPRMVDVGPKDPSRRTARAHAFVRMSPEVLAELPRNPKGDPFAIARVAGILAAKRTAELIPLC